MQSNRQTLSQGLMNLAGKRKVEEKSASLSCAGWEMRQRDAASDKLTLPGYCLMHGTASVSVR